MTHLAFVTNTPCDAHGAMLGVSGFYSAAADVGGIGRR